MRAVPFARKVIGERLRIITKFKDDEANTRNETVLMMLVGGGRSGGIHGAHLGPGVHIRYAAADKKRQTIPWVEYRNQQTGRLAPIWPTTPKRMRSRAMPSL